jgi:hypothetical protein
VQRDFREFINPPKHDPEVFARRRPNYCYLEIFDWVAGVKKIERRKGLKWKIGCLYRIANESFMTEILDAFRGDVLSTAGDYEPVGVYTWVPGEHIRLYQMDAVKDKVFWEIERV